MRGVVGLKIENGRADIAMDVTNEYSPNIMLVPYRSSLVIIGKS